MNYSYIAFYTDEDVKEHLDARDDGKHVAPNPQQKRVICDGAAGAGDGCRDANHLHTNHVVGEDVRGIHGFTAALFPPAPEAKEQDKDGEREEE